MTASSVLGFGRSERRDMFKSVGAKTPAVVRATQVEIPIDKKCQVTVTVKNTGNATLAGDIYMYAFYGFDFPASTGDPATDYSNWNYYADVDDSGSAYDVVLAPEDTISITGSSPWEGRRFSVRDVLDVGIVIAFDDGTGKKYVDSLLYVDYIKIVGAGKLEISDVIIEAVD